MKRGLECFEEALQKDPNSALAYSGLADSYGLLGSFNFLPPKEAYPKAHAALGEAYGWARQYDKAIEQLRETLEMDPNFARTHLDLGVTCEYKAMFDEAIAEFQKARELGGENWPELRAPLQRAYEASGYRGYYQEQLRLLKELSKHSYVAPVSIAMIYARLGDKESAFTWLEKANRDQTSLFFIKVEPVYDPMRSDPRFRDLLHRAGLRD